jgi:hypothetical protein
MNALTKAIEAARNDPHGGKVMLTVEQAEAIAKALALKS